MIRARGVRPSDGADLLGADRHQRPRRRRCPRSCRRGGRGRSPGSSGTSPARRRRSPRPCRSGERRLETGEALDGGVGADGLVAVEHGHAAEVLDRDDRVVEVAVGPRLRGAVVRLGGVRVDVLAVPALDRGDQVGADALRHEAGLERGGRVHRPGAAVAAHRHAAHRLDAAGDDQVLEARAHALGGLVDGLEAGGAEAVELHAGDGLGIAGLERGGLGDVAALVADGGHHAEHDVVDAARVQAGVAGLELVEESDDQVDRLHLVQRTDGLAAAARCADVVVDECFCHAADCDTITVTVQQVCAASPRRHAREERMERWRPWRTTASC